MQGIQDSFMIQGCLIIQTWISTAAESKNILNSPIINTNDIAITPYVLGDPAYPLST